MDVQLVQDGATLRTLCAHLASSSWIALDTEFTRESTYYAKLGLLQLATEHLVACIDPLAVDLAPALDLLYEPSRLKILHAGRQDLEVFYDLRGDVPRPLFDTQIAAALSGHPAQIGYGALVESIAGVKLPKLHTRTDWRARPLTAEQLRYAADDVRYLEALHRALDAELRRRGREEWLKEECDALTSVSLYRNDPETAHLRLNPSVPMSAAAQTLLKALAAWRERAARRRDRPRSWIAADALLIEIARAAPTDRERLARVPQMTAAVLRAHGDEILDAVRSAGGAPPEIVWQPPRPATSAEQVLVRRMLERVYACAQAQNIRAEVIATKRSVYSLVRERAGPLARGWRHELIGRQLLAMVAEHATAP